MTQNYVILFDKMAESKFEVSVVREAANRSAVRLGYSLEKAERTEGPIVVVVTPLTACLHARLLLVDVT